MDLGARRFHLADYVVFFSTIAVSLGIGVYFAVVGRGHSSNSEYLMGSRQLKVIPVTISLLVTFTSTISILGVPAEIYLYGTQFAGFLIATVIGVLCSVFLFVPLLYPLKLTSTFEYHRLRYGSRSIELLTLFVTLLNMILYNGILVFSPCVAFEAVSGFPTTVSMIICGFSGTIYTTIGGMKAVIWTDVFQSVIILAGLLAVVISGTVKAGGIAEVWRLNTEWGRVQGFDFDPDPTKRHTFWSIVVLNSVLWMCVSGAQQSVQRYSALPTIGQAKLSMLLNVPALTIVGALSCLTGVVAFGYFASKGCDPYTAGLMPNPNQILPLLVMEVLNYPALPGLFIACLFSASLSSLSSSLNAMAAVTWENVLKSKLSYLQERTQTRIVKLSAFIYGLLAIGMGFLVKEIGGTLIQVSYSILGCTGGPIIGVIFIGSAYPKAGHRGVLIAAIVGLVISLWLGFGANFSQPKAFTPPLLGPTSACYLLLGESEAANQSGQTSNINESYVAEAFYSAAPTPVSWAPGNVTEGAWPAAANMSATKPPLHLPPKTGLRWFYSISYFWYPSIGITIVMTIGFLTSFIPGLRQKELVPARLMFPCSRSICRSCLEPERSEGDEEGTEKENGTLSTENRALKEGGNIDHDYPDEIIYLKDPDIESRM